MNPKLSDKWRKGQWVRNSGPNAERRGQVGQVAGTSRGLVYVDFPNYWTDGAYGCHPDYLTKLSPREGAIEEAKMALGVTDGISDDCSNG